MRRIRSKLIILRLALLGLFHLNCAKEPINFENEMVQRDNKYYLKGQNEPYTGPIYSSYSNNTLRSKGDVSDGKKDGLFTNLLHLLTKYFQKIRFQFFLSREIKLI